MTYINKIKSKKKNRKYDNFFPVSEDSCDFDLILLMIYEVRAADSAAPKIEDSPDLHLVPT